MISFGRHICNDFNIATEKEWILANRKGSYACSTILMTNTRKHHGLLVAKLPSVDSRVVVFPNTDEEIETAGHIYHISTHKYKKTVYPKGYSLLENIRVKDDVVTFLYLIDNIRLKKDVYLLKDANATVVTYTILTPESHAKLHIRPMIAFRETDQLVREMPIFDPTIEKAGDGNSVTIHAYMNMPPAFISLPDGGDIKLEGVWYRDFSYLKEEASGNEGTEDLYNLGLFTLALEFNVPKSIIYATDDIRHMTMEEIRGRFGLDVARVHDICAETGACIKDDDYRTSVQQLISASESFIINDEKGTPFILAGLPWPHYIWFRDMLASIPGVFLVLKKYDDAKKLLIETLNFEKNGLLPLNMTIDKNDVKYASVDTTLWFFFALYKYLQASGDFALTAADSDFYAKISGIIDRHINGTDFNIHMDTDGLLYAGFPGMQLTWMDTKVNGMPVAPRQGKPVEVNALWYNAIRTMEVICAKNGDKEKQAAYRELAEKIFKSFNEQYWNEETGCLYDYIDSGYKDENVRPNQVLAISLPFPLIERREKTEKIMNTVIKELYTSFGLRSLSNMSVQFKSRYDGDQASRDAAAHQGTVWAWTAGHFVTAYLKAYGSGKDSISFIETVYEPFFEHLKTAGLSTISEVFDGHFPYTARGRISHAWAVAELLRSYFEDFINAQKNG